MLICTPSGSLFRRSEDGPPGAKAAAGSNSPARGDRDLRPALGAVALGGGAARLSGLGQRLAREVTALGPEWPVEAEGGAGGLRGRPGGGGKGWDSVTSMKRMGVGVQNGSLPFLYWGLNASSSAGFRRKNGLNGCEPKELPNGSQSCFAVWPAERSGLLYQGGVPRAARINGSWSWAVNIFDRLSSRFVFSSPLRTGTGCALPACRLFLGLVSEWGFHPE